MMNGIEMQKAVVILKNDGGYDGTHGMKFPLTIDGNVCQAMGWVVGWVDVQITELEKHGYYREAGQSEQVKDSSPFDDVLTWILGGEAEVVEILS